MANVQNAVRKSTKSARAIKRRAARKPSVNGRRQAVQKRVTSTEPSRPALSEREKLEQERALALAELERLRAELQESPEPTGDEVDLNVYEREKTLGLVATYERRLEEIERARRAAEKGAYGICVRCGKPIDPERLRIFPEATMDVNCKNEVERLARRARLQEK